MYTSRPLSVTFIRETARKWSPQQAKAYGRLLREGFERIPEAYARSKNQPDQRVGASLFRLYRIEHHYAAYIVVDEMTFVVAAVLHERMDIPRQIKAIEELSDRDFKALMGKPRNRE